MLFGDRADEIGESLALRSYDGDALLVEFPMMLKQILEETDRCVSSDSAPILLPYLLESLATFYHVRRIPIVLLCIVFPFVIAQLWVVFFVLLLSDTLSF